MAGVFETSKLTTRDITPLKADLLLLPKQFYHWGPSIQTRAFGGHIPQSDSYSVPEEVLLCRRNNLKQEKPHSAGPSHSLSPG